MENVTIGLAFIAGFLSFVSPCCLPLVPAYIGYMSGRMTHAVALQTAGDAKSKSLPAATASTRLLMLLHGLAFVAGFTFVFVTIGLATTAFVSIMGSAVTILTDIIARVGGMLIILFGLHFMGVLRWLFKKLKQNPGLLNPITSMVAALALSAFILWGFIILPLALPVLAGTLLALLLGGAFADPRAFWLRLIDRLETMLYSDTRGEMQQTRGGLAGSFMMGVIFSAGWTPCIGPLLGTILTLAATTGDAGSAVPLLTAYSLGLGIPFLLAALLMDGAKSILRRLQRHVHKIEMFSGALLVVIGFLVMTGQLTILSQSLNTQFADFSYRLEDCGVGVFNGEIQANQVGSCLNGSLLAVAVNQSAAGKLTDDAPQMEYVFHVEQAMMVDVEIQQLADTEVLTMNIQNASGTTVAQNDNVPAGKGDQEVIPFSQLYLDAGMYTILVQRKGVGKMDFRIKVKEATALPPVSVIPATSSGGDSAIAELAEAGKNNLTGTPTPADTAVEPDATAASSGGITSELNTITGGASASLPVRGTSLGDRAPDFTLTGDDGKSVTLSDLQGKVVLLNFWGTWCGPCRREMPDLQDLYEQYHDQGFEIVAVAVRDTPDAVKAFRQEFGLTFALVLDDGEGSKINDLYAIPGQPSTFILDKSGVIVFQSYSVVMRDDVEAVIKAAMK